MNNKVMIVDDEPDVLDSLRMVLENENYDVVTVGSGEECLKKLEEGFEGIILMDILMPGMNGFDTIKEIVSRGYINNVAMRYAKTACLYSFFSTLSKTPCHTAFKMFFQTR